jgi:fimbrial chaperone protein
VRQSIPVFFRARLVAPARVAWSVRREQDRLVVTGTNSGDERLRIASLSLRDAAGVVVSFGNGLVGYVLGRSAMNFTVPAAPRGFGLSGAVSVSAESNNGPVHAMAQFQGQP